MKNYTCQDRVIVFDIPEDDLNLCSGEKIIDKISNIEDLKGNNGDIGQIIITNIRLIYSSNQNKKSNISIGLSTIQDISSNFISSTISGQTNATQLICKSGNRRYELEFCSRNEKKLDLKKTISNILKIYIETRAFRDVKEKSNIGKNKEVKLLYDEIEEKKYNNVMYYVKEDNKFYSGYILLSNIRFIWVCLNIDNFNISIPWIQMIQVIEKRITEKQFPCMIVNVSSTFSNKEYAFGINGKENYISMINETKRLMTMYTEEPLLSIDLEKALKEKNKKNEKTNKDNDIHSQSENKHLKNEEEKKNEKSNELHNKEEEQKTDIKLKKNKNINLKNIFETEITNENFLNENASAIAYMINKESEKENRLTDIIFCHELGVATQKLPGNSTVDDLWKILK